VIVRADTPETPGTASLLERMRAALSGRYAIEREVGRGAMATVYLARDLKHDRQVAIKVLADDLATTIGAARFLREIKVAAQLLHPNILGLIDSGEAQGSLYYIMPYVRGETLRDRLDREKRLSVPEAVRIACEVASALEHAHEYGVIHRDIKPENILLVNGHHAVVADFGLARAVFNASSNDRTSTGLVVGSPYYMSPEQATGEQDIDGRTDIYSLGCVLFEMLTGGPPFKGKTVQSVLTQQLTASVPRVRARRADLSVSLDELVQRALAKDPQQRIQTAQEFSQELAAQIGAAHKTQRTSNAWHWLNEHRRGVLALAAGIALVTVVVARWTADGRGGFGALLRPELDTARYVVLPFRRAANVPENLSVEYLLHDALHRWQGVDVIDQFQMEARLPRDGGLSERTAKSLSVHFRAGRYVWGDVTRAGDSVRIDAAVYDTKTGASLHHESLRAGVGDVNIASAISTLAAKLLYRGAVKDDRTAATIGTNSYPAHQAYLRGQSALAELNLAAADSAFAEALEHDPEYAAANLWAAQVKGWISDNPLEWQGMAERAAAAGERHLPARERQLATALVLIAQGRMPEACNVYRKLKAANTSDFVATFGIGECNRLDDVVVSDKLSRSGWSFRGSAHSASRAYLEAFQLIPGMHKAFYGEAFGRVRRLMFTAANLRRPGRALPPDTTQFRASPSWEGDTLAFVPFPMHEEIAHPGRVRWPSTVKAVDHQRALLREIAATWRSAYPASTETMEAMALALELQGDSSAIDTLRAARRLADSDLQRRRLAASEVLLLIKFGVPDNTPALIAARTLADSLLKTSADEVPTNAELIASLAVFTGRSHMAANLARRSGETTGNVGGRTAANSRALLAYAAIGGAADSIKRLEQRIAADVRNTIAAEEQTATLYQLVGRAAGLAFTVYPFATLPQLVGRGNRMLDAQLAFVNGNGDSARAILSSMASRRESLRPADRTLDITYPGACLVLSADGVAAAMMWIDPVLNGAQFFPPEHLSQPANAGGFMRALLLRAELARRSGDPAEAARWDRPVDILWANADPGLKASIKASHQRLATRTAAR
jgi:eukaryotic-like serine/threonine-protein kinase